MNEHVELKYGERISAFDIKDASSIEYLYENKMPEIEDISLAFEKAVGEGVINSKPLSELVVPGDKITVVISDLTRFWMRQDIVCELLIKYLEKCGINDDDIAVLVGLGTHRQQTEEELCRLASEYVYKHVRVVNHDCDGELVRLGTTSFGTDVDVHPLAVGRKVIMVGGTIHHLMAGYGGGRKSVLPGICGRETIRQNHAQALSPTLPKSNELIGSGKLINNPINLDMGEAADMVNPIFGINIVVNSKRKHSGLFCGEFHEAWLESCRFCQKYYGLPIDHEADIVIVSCGGYPKDLNLYQGVKSLINGIQALKEGGTCIFLAECREGGGAPDFFDWIKPLNEGRLDEALRKAFTIAGYIFYASCESIRKAGKFYMQSEFSPETVKGMGICSYKSIEEIVKNIDFTGKSVYVIPNGGSLLPQMPETYKKYNSEF